MNNQNNNRERLCCQPIPDDHVSKVLEKIIRMQKQALRIEADETCDREMFGIKERCETNTRPITFYAHDRGEWMFPTNRESSGCEGGEKSCVFRVEKVEDDTVTCRVLDRVGGERFVSTDSFFTIKIDAIAAYRCLEDTFVEICIR